MFFFLGFFSIVKTSLMCVMFSVIIGASLCNIGKYQKNKEKKVTQGEEHLEINQCLSILMFTHNVPYQKGLKGVDRRPSAR